MGVELLDSRFLDFLDPWGNRVEITTYTNIQFSKTPGVLRGMGLSHLQKTDEALGELRKKGMAPDGFLGLPILLRRLWIVRRIGVVLRKLVQQATFRQWLQIRL